MILWEDPVAGVSAELISRPSPTPYVVKCYCGHLRLYTNQAGDQGMLHLLELCWRVLLR